MAEEDKCAVCDNGDSRTSNQILYCDGKDCDMPVHQLCYGVESIPENDWYCERCKALHFHKRMEVVCCPQQTGALKRTAHPGEFMHIVCAAYNKDVQNEKTPYHYNKKGLNSERCAICNQQQGLCVQCEYPGCTTSFHAQCGVNQGIIHVGWPMPTGNPILCIQHVGLDDSIPAKRPASPTLKQSPPKQFKENNWGIGNSNGLEMASQTTKHVPLFITPKPKQPKLSSISASAASISGPKPTISSPKLALSPKFVASQTPKPALNKAVSPPKLPVIPAKSSITPTAAKLPVTAAPLTAAVSSRITEDSLKQTEINYLSARLDDAKKDLKKAQEKANEVKDIEKRLHESQQQVERMKKEMAQQKDFKRTVTDIFMALNIQIANHMAPSPHKMDEYVRLLRDTLNRTGPPSESEWIQIVNLSNALAMEKRK